MRMVLPLTTKMLQEDTSSRYLHPFADKWGHRGSPSGQGWSAVKHNRGDVCVGGGGATQLKWRHAGQTRRTPPSSWSSCNWPGPQRSSRVGLGIKVHNVAVAVLLGSQLRQGVHTFAEQACEGYCMPTGHVQACCVVGQQAGAAAGIRAPAPEHAALPPARTDLPPCVGATARRATWQGGHAARACKIKDQSGAHLRDQHGRVVAGALGAAHAAGGRAAR